MNTPTKLSALVEHPAAFFAVILAIAGISCMSMPTGDDSNIGDPNDNGVTTNDNGSANDNAAAGGGTLDDSVIEFPTENGTAVVVTQGDELEAVFETEMNKAGDDESVRRLRVTSTAVDVAAEFDDEGRISDADVDDATIDVTYGENDQFDYVVMSGGEVIVQGSANLNDYDDDQINELQTTTAAFRAQLFSTFGGDDDEPSLKKAVALCSMSLGSSFGVDAARNCDTMLSGTVESCYATCLQRNPQYNSIIASICTLVQILGRVQAEEVKSCLERMDRPEDCCRRLERTSDSLQTYLHLQGAIIIDMANGLRTVDSCPYADLSRDSQCGGVSFNIIERCPGLADNDGDMGDGGGGDDMGDGQDQGGDDNPDTKDDPVVCNEQSVPPDPNCFNVVNITDQGFPSASSVFQNDNDNYGVGLAIDNNSSSSWFSDGNPDGTNDAEAYTWTFGENVDIYLARVETDPEQFDGGGSFGFASATVRVLDASGAEVYNSGAMSLDAFRVDFTEAFPAGQLGRSVQLILVGHQNKSCGGFAEMRVYGYELITTEDSE